MNISELLSRQFLERLDREMFAAFTQAMPIDDPGSMNMDKLMAAVRAVEAGPKPFLHIVSSIHMTEPYEDWSNVRSKPRARRRRRKGYRQNIVNRERPRSELFIVDGIAYAHPTTLAAIKHQIAGG